MNYIGYFRSLEGNDQYSVRLVTDTASTEYTEIKLAGDSPFVVTYNESETPFDPVRTSTAVIKVVRNDYLEGIYSPYAQGTQVILTNEKTNTRAWVGYLVPRIYSQAYEDCYETVEVEAADCISSLQYFDYQDQGETRGIVYIKDILNSICDRCGLLTEYAWTRSKKVGTAVMLPEHLMISEQNFHSSDTDEPWKLSTVLEEICRYFGFTAFQWESTLYFADLEYFSNNETLYSTLYRKSNNYSTSYTIYGPNPYTITEDTYRGNGASISFEPIYNKVTVKDNLYIADEAIPSIFEDKYLTNSFIPCNFDARYEVTPETPDKARYPWKGNTKSESVGDSQYHYWERPFTHEYWESHYYDTGMTEVNIGTSLGLYESMRDYVGATIVDLTTAKNPYSEGGGIAPQVITPSSKDTTRYLCICQKGCEYRTGGQSSIYKPLFNIKPGFKSLCPFSSDAYLVINYSMLFEKYENRAYINPEWTTETVYTDWYISSNGNKLPRYDGYNFPTSNCGDMFMRVTIGNAWWQPYRNRAGGHILVNTWNTASTSSTEYIQDSIFNVDSRWQDDAFQGVIQSDVQTNNTVSWKDNLNVEGYKIPLAGVNLEDDIKIEIFLPTLQFTRRVGDFPNEETKYNAYCWVKDLSFSIVEPSDGDADVDADVVYENVIDQDAINELSEITLKITTKAENTKPSYSNVVYKRNGNARLLDTVKEDSISGTPQFPEENIIEKYVKEYSTPTKKIQATQELSGIIPITKIYGADVDNIDSPYTVLGQTLDYANGSQTITMVQIK